MHAEPLCGYETPDYPTRREAAVEMNWLKRHWPAAWR